ARADDVLSALVDGGSGRDRRLLRDRDARAGNEAALRRGAAARPRLLPRLRGEDGRWPSLQHVAPRRRERPRRPPAPQDPPATPRRARAVAPVPAPREGLLRGRRSRLA